jgi:hypothetical protein
MCWCAVLCVVLCCGVMCCVVLCSIVLLAMPSHTCRGAHLCALLQRGQMTCVLLQICKHIIIQYLCTIMELHRSMGIKTKKYVHCLGLICWMMTLYAAILAQTFASHAV